MTQERMLILEMIESGKITAEEGLVLLNAIGSPEPESGRVDWTGGHGGHGGHGGTGGFSMPVPPAPPVPPIPPIPPIPPMPPVEGRRRGFRISINGKVLGRRPRQP